MPGDLQEVILDFHVRAFGEELARINFASKDERWAYVHQLWARIHRAKARAAVTDTSSNTDSSPTT